MTPQEALDLLEGRKTRSEIFQDKKEKGNLSTPKPSLNLMNVTEVLSTTLPVISIKPNRTLYPTIVFPFFIIAGAIGLVCSIYNHKPPKHLIASTVRLRP